MFRFLFLVDSPSGYFSNCLKVKDAQIFFTCGRRANLFAGPLCWARRRVDLQTPVVLKTAKRTWPSRLVETRWVSPVSGKNFDWNTLEWWPEGKDTHFFPLSQSHTIISLSSEPDASRLPDSLKCSALTQPCKWKPEMEQNWDSNWIQSYIRRKRPCVCII